MDVFQFSCIFAVLYMKLWILLINYIKTDNRWRYCELIMMIIWRYGASAGAVDSDVWYMLMDSSSDVVRAEVMQTDQLSTIRNTDCHINLAQLPTSQQHRQHCSLLLCFKKNAAIIFNNRFCVCSSVVMYVRAMMMVLHLDLSKLFCNNATNISLNF